jgi:hypothetical protein
MNKDLRKASYEIDLALGGYQKAARYYKGEVLGEGLFDRFQVVADSFKGILNFCATPVEAVSNKLQLLAIKGATEQINTQIVDLMDANKMALRFNQLIIDILMYGDSYICVWPEDVDPEDGDVDTPLQEGGSDIPLNHKAKMTFCNPETTRAFYDDGGELKFVARKWEEIDDDDENIVYIRTNLYYKDRIEKYIWLKGDGPKQAEPYFDEDQEEWPMENPYGIIPIFHFSTAFPYGVPEHVKLYGVQDALTKIFQTHIDAIEFLGFPIVYMLLDEEMPLVMLTDLRTLLVRSGLLEPRALVRSSLPNPTTSFSR